MNKKQNDQIFGQVKKALTQALQKYDDAENERVETDCSICFNVMIDSCLLPCRHRFCVQCMREHLGYQEECPLCRQKVPSYFKCQFYMANVDQEFKQVIKKRLPLDYELGLLGLLKDGMQQVFQMSFEVGQYYMGYENPSNCYDHEQKFKTNEWTVFIRTENPSFRPMISQFITSVDF